jgi:probable phosphoglycerate mutase
MPEASTILHLARHGETADNAAHVFQGQSGKGLDARGRAQAVRLAERLRRRRRGERIAAIVSSDLERAVETAQIVAHACDLPSGSAIELDPALREVDLGLWTGKRHDEIAELYPEEWAAWVAGLDLRRGGGETYAELAVRVAGAIDRIVASHAGQQVLVVSHGGAIRSFVSRLLGVSQEGFRALAILGNASLSVLERDARGRDRLHAWNDTAHLEGLVVDDHTD